MSLQKLPITTSDNVQIEIDQFVIKKSCLLQQMIADLCIDFESNETIDALPLQNHSSQIMQLVSNYCAHYSDREPEANVDDTQWNNQFLDAQSPATLLELISVANFLDIKALRTIVCLYVGKAINGRSPEDIGIILGYDNDFSEEDKKMVCLINA
uniref:Skp1-related protein n=1 Tax=Rhabditophanes sp. KR3021 TaxID=114890 RepID=A0AC35TG73_9BILA